MRIVAAGDEKARKGQGLSRNRTEALHSFTPTAALDVRRGDEQRTDHALLIAERPALFGPPGNRQTAEAMRGDQDGRGGSPDLLVQPTDPFRAFWKGPVTHLHSLAPVET